MSEPYFPCVIRPPESLGTPENPSAYNTFNPNNTRLATHAHICNLGHTRLAGLGLRYSQSMPFDPDVTMLPPQAAYRSQDGMQSRGGCKSSTLMLEFPAVNF